MHQRFFNDNRNFIFLCILLLALIKIQAPSPSLGTTEGRTVSEQTPPAEEPFSDLNLRLSNRALIPPQDLIIETFALEGITVARPIVAPAPKAVIFEDDQRQRVAVLSQDAEGKLTLFLLEPLPLDPKLPGLVQCASIRRCQTDRRPLTGGLSCLAICIKDMLEAAALNM